MTNIEYEKKALTLNNNEVPVVHPVDINFLNTIEEFTPIYKLFTNIKGNSLGTNVFLDMGKFNATWRGELEDVQTNGTSPININVPIKELVASLPISRRLLDINNLNILSYIEKNIQKSFFEKIDLGVLYGKGDKEINGILPFFAANKKNKFITQVEVNVESLLINLLTMENKLPRIYKKQAFWLMSRTFHIAIQEYFYKNPINTTVIATRDDINYKLFNRPLYICDELDCKENTENVHCILVHPNAYTIVEDLDVKTIQNNMELDFKINFIKYIGGSITDPSGIIFGILTR